MPDKEEKDESVAVGEANRRPMRLRKQLRAANPRAIRI